MRCENTDEHEVSVDEVDISKPPLNKAYPSRQVAGILFYLI